MTQYSVQHYILSGNVELNKSTGEVCIVLKYMLLCAHSYSVLWPSQILHASEAVAGSGGVGTISYCLLYKFK